MAKAETNIQNKIRLAIDHMCTTFRNHVGMVKDENGWVHRFGLCKGSSDVVGWTSVIVTPQMVGKSVAVFTAIEVKTKTGKETKAQFRFRHKVTSSGGIAFVARSPEEAQSKLSGYLASLTN